MKKLIAVFLALVIIMLSSIGLADANWGTKSLNDAEIDAVALSAFLGDGKIMNLPSGTDEDVVNSRYIFIGDKTLGADLVVMIRISDSQVCLWMLELNKENLIKAKLALNEKAPLCYVSLYENGIETKSAMYVQSFSSIFPYDKFSSDAEEVFRAIGGEVGENVSDDPVLSLFPGLVWGMTQDEMIAKYGSDYFTEVGKTEKIMASVKSVLGEDTHIVFMFSEGKLDSITLMTVKERLDQFREAYKSIYGEPIKVSFMDTVFGDYSEKADGDSDAWRTGQTYIMINGWVDDIEYKPLY